MSVNSFTLNNLYNQGILDYVPYELCNGANVSAMNGMQNPYLNSAMQGGLYQNHGLYGDSVEIGLGNRNIGSQSLAGGVNSYGLNGVGSQSNAGGVNAYGLDGIGSQSNAGINAYGIEGIGANSPDGEQALGGFGDVRNNFQNTVSKVESMPKFLKGIIAGGLMVGSVALLFRRGKKPPVEKTPGFFAKLNPFKKKTI